MIYTIGYSTRTLPEFIKELDNYNITTIIDVRSRPWSRNPSFNANQIERWSASAHLMYKQLGHILGDQAGVELQDVRYQSSLQWIVDAARRENVAVFCAEGDPALCHRAWDIGASLLLQRSISSANILRNGGLEKIEVTINRIRRSNFAPSILSAIDQLGPFDLPENTWFR